MDDYLRSIEKSEEYGIPWLKDIEKKSRNGQQTADMFINYSEHFRVYFQSHIYGGSCETDKIICPVYRDGKLVLQEIYTPDLLLRFFIEILSNATDNVINSRMAGVTPEQIVIEMTRDTITIRNDGLPFPIFPREEESSGSKIGTTVDFAFGRVGCGTNLSQEINRQTAGTNGIGSKLTNIFSRWFEVLIGDNIRGVKQRVVWTRNMCTKLVSQCIPQYKRDGSHYYLDGEPYTGKNFTEITYKTDFRKFEQTEYTIDEFELFKKIAVDASFAVKIPIIFNGEKLDFRDIDKLAKAVGGEDSKNRIVINQLSEQDKQLNLDPKELDKRIKNGEIVPKLEVCMICKPGQGFDVSYTNGVYNKDGGVHTNKVYKVILDAIKQISKEEKSLGLDKYDLSKLNITFLKQNAIAIINYKCLNASFDSQMKNLLKKPEPNFGISGENIVHLKKWKIFSVLYDKYNAKSTKSISKDRMCDDNFIDANFVGKKGYDTVLFVGEGQSAGGNIAKFIIELGKLLGIKGVSGSDLFAVYGMKGKIKNISQMENSEIDQPENSGKTNTIVKIMEIIGLIDGVDYTTQEGYDSLRYKKCTSMCDADNDGSHILCLLINLFYRRFPSFLKAGRLSWFNTPLIRAINKTTKKTIKKFYTVKEYEDWRIDNPNIKHKPDYFKGLATSSAEQLCDDARTSPNVILWFDDEADIYLNIAFDQLKESSAKRKKWILDFKNTISDPIVRKKFDERERKEIYYAKISDIVNTKLVEYSLETLPRCIPSNKDHLKHSIRIVMCYCLKLYKFGKSNDDELKTDSMATKSKEEYNYHHGAASLEGLIPRLVQDYAGANNLPFLNNVSAMGSRIDGGQKPGAPRYTKSKPNWWVKFLFKEDLFDLVPKKIVEGKEVEPEWVPCLLPLAPINGTKGVSTGWSTEMTNYHPRDILMWVYNFIANRDLFPLVPWFIRFNGDISLEKLTKKKRIKKKNFEENPEETTQTTQQDHDQEEDVNEGEVILKTTGIYRILKQYEKEINVEEDDPDNYGKKLKIKKLEKFTDFEILEYPIGVIPKNLMKTLSKRCKEAPELQDDDYHPKYKFKGYMGSFSDEDIGMITTRKMSNINLISDDGLPTKYKNIYQVLADYCDNMIDLYKLRKKKRIETLEEKLAKISNKKFLVKKVIDNEWYFVHKKRKTIEEELYQMQIPYEIFKSIASDSYTLEGYQEIVDQYNSIYDEIQKVTEQSSIHDWKEELIAFSAELDKYPEYNKLEKHEFPIMYCELDDLLSGKIYSPFQQ